VKVRVSGTSPARAGETVTVSVPDERLCVFVGGKRLSSG